MHKYVITLEWSHDRVLAQLAAMATSDIDSTKSRNFFLSPAWAYRYLSQWPSKDFFVAMAISKQTSPEECIPEALVVFSHGCRASRLSLGHRSLGFNESTCTGLESVTVEANGMIGLSDLPFADAISMVMDELVKLKGWDELRINALTHDEAICIERCASECGLLNYIYSEQETHWIEFADIQAYFYGDYLASRSANTRQQLRRAARSIGRKFGELSVTRAATSEQGHAWLDALAVLHKKRWNGEGSQQCFADFKFSAFHHFLVDDMLDAGELDILRICAGEEAIGYMYYFIVAGRVYFNMGGVDYERFSNYHPGLLCHVQAITYYQERGAKIYDFMVGTNRYKQSLATSSSHLTGLVVQRPLLRFRVESLLRNMKRRRHTSPSPNNSLWNSDQ